MAANGPPPAAPNQGKPAFLESDASLSSHDELVRFLTNKKHYKRKRSRSTFPFHTLSDGAVPWTRESNNALTVFYEVQAGLSPLTRYQLAVAMDHIQINTCIRFTWRTTAPRVLVQQGTNPNACFGGFTSLTVAAGGCGIGVLIHEVLHTVGFQHQHQAPGASNFVTFNSGNADPAQCSTFCTSAFQEFPSNAVENNLTPFDFQSIMMYNDDAFAKAGTKTLTVKPGATGAVGLNGGNWDGNGGMAIGKLSNTDIAKINGKFACPNPRPPFAYAITRP